MSDNNRPPLLAFGLTEMSPPILRDVVCTPARAADDAAARPSMLAFGLIDRVPSYRPPEPSASRFVWGAAPADAGLLS